GGAGATAGMAAGAAEDHPVSGDLGRRGLLRSRSRDLTSAQYIRQRQPDWSGIDRRLSAPGYLAPSVRVLALHASGEQIEITLPSQAIDVVLPPLGRHQGTTQSHGYSPG